MGREPTFGLRELLAEDRSSALQAILVRNHDLPIYVDHAIAGLGICGSDVIDEADGRFLQMDQFYFRGSMFCLATTMEQVLADGEELTIATSPTRASRAATSAGRAYPRRSSA